MSTTAFDSSVIHVSRDARSARPSLVSNLWGIDWNRELPLTLTSDGISVEYGSFDSASSFIAAHYAQIFEQVSETSVFAGGQVSAAKARYYHEVGDFFEFILERRTIGLLICTPLDWSTYYLRSGAILPEYQGRKLLQRFLPTICATLARAGVERIEADTSPSNLAMMHVLTRLRFNVTGTTLTERWGAHVHFTKFLDEGSEGVFLRQFCSGVKYQARERRHDPELAAGA